jgi:aspartyl-tRNA(Asn)/glutamyl-tRNA(Gln) amidotransferase subunit A
VAALLTRAAEAFTELGCAVEQASIPALERTDWNLLTMTLYGGGGGPYLERAVAGRHDQLHPALRRRLAARVDSLADYVAAEEAVEELRRDVAAFFVDHDVLLCPSVPTAAHGHDAMEVAIAGQAQSARATMRATIPWDLTGSPALSLPFAFSADGLPLGIQLVGRRFEDELVLRAAAALERLRGDFPRPAI